MQTIHISSLNLWASDAQSEPIALARPLQELMGFIRMLRLRASSSTPNIPSLCNLNIHQFDMCNMITPRISWGILLPVASINYPSLRHSRISRGYMMP
jgi:hypothetical protein